MNKKPLADRIQRYINSLWSKKCGNCEDLSDAHNRCPNDGEYCEPGKAARELSDLVRRQTQQLILNEKGTLLLAATVHELNIIIGQYRHKAPGVFSAKETAEQIKKFQKPLSKSVEIICSSPEYKKIKW